MNQGRDISANSYFDKQIPLTILSRDPNDNEAPKLKPFNETVCSLQ